MKILKFLFCRSTMLLRNGPEIPMDDISLSMRTNLENGRL
jgi:hypothetical protein